jgi:hypothetical protein
MAVQEHGPNYSAGATTVGWFNKTRRYIDIGPDGSSGETGPAIFRSAL